MGSEFLVLTQTGEDPGEKIISVHRSIIKVFAPGILIKPVQRIRVTQNRPCQLLHEVHLVRKGRPHHCLFQNRSPQYLPVFVCDPSLKCGHNAEEIIVISLIYGNILAPFPGHESERHSLEFFRVRDQFGSPSRDLAFQFRNGIGEDRNMFLNFGKEIVILFYEPADFLHGTRFHISAHFFADQFLNYAVSLIELLVILMTTLCIMPDSPVGIVIISSAGHHDILVFCQIGPVICRE